MTNATKYCFKVYLRNGETKKIVPKEMNNMDLQDFDLFSINKGGFFGLCEILSQELSVASYQINKITIDYLKKEREFSLISNNQYILPIVSKLYPQKISSNRNYLIDAILVPKNDPTYLEMKKYLFTNLKTKGAYFLTEVYDYQNQFHDLLSQYQLIYQQGVLSEEDDRNLKELERIISVELSIYQNFRSLSIARKRNEETIKRNIQKKENQQHTKNLKITNYATINHYSIQPVKEETIKDAVITFNQKYEEFLEPEEYEQMLGEDSSNNKYFQ